MTNGWNPHRNDSVIVEDADGNKVYGQEQWAYRHPDLHTVVFSGIPTSEPAPTQTPLEHRRNEGLLSMEEQGEDPPADERAERTAAAQAEHARRQAEGNATEAAVKLASEKGVDLTQVTGTGSEGRTTVDDVKGVS